MTHDHQTTVNISRTPSPLLDSRQSVDARGLARVYQIGSVQVTGIRDIDLTISAGQLVVRCRRR